MAEVTRKLLLKFQENTKGYKPQRIIMFRDGVSEGQFMTVLVQVNLKGDDLCQDEVLIFLGVASNTAGLQVSAS